MSILPGTLIKLDINRNVSPENLLLANTQDGHIRLYEEIDIGSYPGWEDFKGYSRLFKDEILLVIAKKGRPLSFSKKEKWDLYDVYYVTYESKVYECFSHCMQILAAHDLKKIS